MPAGPYRAVIEKLTRAFRNGTGTRFSNDELRALAKLGVVHMLAKAEADEIVAELDTHPIERES